MNRTHRTTRRPAVAGAPHRFVTPLLGLLAAAVLAACSSQAAQGQGEMPPPEVSVAEVVARPVAHWDEFTGRVAAVESVELRPRVSGYIERVAFREGDEVAKGDLLFVIDQRPYRAELARAEAQLARARSEAQLARTQDARAEELLAAAAISREEHEARRAASSQTAAAVRAAEAAVTAARLDLQYTEIRAPIDGRIGRALITAGNLAQADATLLTTLVSLDPVHVHFDADEQSFLRYQALARSGERENGGNAVRVGLVNEQGHPHEGVLDFTDNHVDPNTGTIRARAVVANPDRVFTPGLHARVQLQATGERPALLIDERAVLTDQDRKYVYVLGENDQAERRDIAPGRSVAAGEGARLLVVQEGLAPGDRVIVHGVQKVFFPGMPVAPVPVEMGDPAPSAQVASTAAP
ncbi:efflux RND transporter periplasmic adaptor subunit [Luteimonas sp. SJ-92]|uniref:Efflux RND transporter periplasmic adaptor subunit n=1 Tax=Luteimonas salinisoli TaxID=2752307 RepID=A0A853JC53_9GAMM|nr:efflux RND transporter periplasmic adaptor subunit [Luteimonas salinisoli]NZA26198.1 efflux RND transporter periplasmic adaptor subunit [Luteimonas salinisoli]